MYIKNKDKHFSTNSLKLPVVIYFPITERQRALAPKDPIHSGSALYYFCHRKTDLRTVQKYRDQLHDSRRSSFPSISAFQPTVVRAASNLKVRRFDRGLSYGAASNLWKPSVLMDL